MFAPILYDFTRKKALVVGAGATGIRRARKLLEYGCVVTVVATRVPQDPEALCGATVNIKNYEARDLAGQDIVVAATDSKTLNARIMREAQDCGAVLCNSVGGEHENFSFPAVVHRGDLWLAVSTSGAVPALSRRIRGELETAYPECCADYVERLSLYRQKILGSALSSAERKQWLEAALDLPEDVLEERILEMTP